MRTAQLDSRYNKCLIRGLPNISTYSSSNLDNLLAVKLNYAVRYVSRWPPFFSDDMRGATWM
jgi:hypothetical protein